jgi:hypothetical protein
MKSNVGLGQGLATFLTRGPHFLGKVRPKNLYDLMPLNLTRAVPICDRIENNGNLN